MRPGRSPRDVIDRLSGAGRPRAARWLRFAARRGLGLALLASALAGCGEPPVMEVGPVGFTADDLTLMTDAQKAQLADLTGFGLAVSQGRTDELTAPFVERELRSLVLQRLAMEVAVDDAGMDEEELRAAYEASPVPELVVRHLVVMSERWRPEEHRDSARALAQEALERARAGESFEELAGEYSDEPGAAERGGLLEPGREGSWVREFWEAANALDEGELSPVVETEYGFHVIRLEERRPVPFEEVRSEVLERFVDLPSALSHAAQWASSQEESLRLDTTAILAWQRGDTVTVPLAAWSIADDEAEGPGPAGSRTEDSAVEGSLSGEELTRQVVTLSEEQRRQIAEGDERAVLAAATTAARNRMLVDRARAMGLEASSTSRAAVERRWSQRVSGWAEVLGFSAGMSNDRVRQAALEALGTQRQNAVIARRELSELSGVLRTLYPVREHSDG